MDTKAAHRPISLTRNAPSLSIDSAISASLLGHWRALAYISELQTVPVGYRGTLVTEPSQRPTTGRLPALLMWAGTEATCPYLVLGSQASWGDSRRSEALGPRLSGWFPASVDYHLPPSAPGFFLEDSLDP